MRLKKLLERAKNNPEDIKFSELSKICDHFFGQPRQHQTSYRIYKTPWQGDPRINIQNNKGKAKAYQVKQVLAAVEKLESGNYDGI